MLRRAATAFVAVLVTLVLGARAEDQAPARRVRYRNDRMSVDLQGAPLTDVMDELRHQSGATIRGQVCKPRALNLSFDNVPLPEALERVLGEQNFTLRYGPGGSLEAVDLLSEPGLSPSPAAAGIDRKTGSTALLPGVGGGGSGGASGASGVEQGRRAAGLSVSAVGGTAANGQTGTPSSPTTVGGGRAQPASSNSQAANSNAQQDQPLSDTELEQRIRHSVLNSLGAMDDASLAAFMDTPEGRRVQALLQYYADHHVGSTRQQQASDIMQRLPGAPAPTPTPAPVSHHAWH